MKQFQTALIILILIAGFFLALPYGGKVLAATPKPTMKVTGSAGTQVPVPPKNVCDFLPNTGGSGGKTPNQQCTSCLKSAGAWTSIGCIPTEPKAFISKFLNFGIGIAGGISFLLILFGGFSILTSAGNPERLNAGRELLTSAIAGLLLVIFSLFLLQLIGYRILSIPGFG